MIYFVYITTNLINSKQYVGEHTANMNDSYLGSGKLLKSTIKKYGKENFKREILEYFNSKEEAFSAQEKYINEYNTLTPNGYNISPKGGCMCGTGCHSEESKDKIRQHILGIKRSEKCKEKNRLSHLGNKDTIETIQKKSAAHIDKKHNQNTKNKIQKLIVMFYLNY